MAHTPLMHQKDKRLFLVYNSGTRAIRVGGHHLHPSSKVIRFESEIPCNPHCAALVFIDEGSAPMYHKIAEAGMVGLVEVLLKSPISLDRFKLAAVPHRTFTPAKFAEEFGLVQKEAPPQPTKTAPKPNVTFPVPPPEPAPPVVVEAPQPEIVEEPTPVVADTPIEPAVAESSVRVVNEELVASIPWDVLEADPHSVAMSDLRAYGAAFDPPMRSTKKDDLAVALLQAAAALNLRG